MLSSILKFPILKHIPQRIYPFARMSSFITKEMAEIRQAVEFERANADVTVLELFKPRMINRTHIGIFTQIWSQLTGMNVMVNAPLSHPLLGLFGYRERL